jgi:hypothetical protein
MRWLFLIGSGCLVACGSAALESNKLKDGTWSFTCNSPMDECMQQVQETCPRERFRIIEGVSETRIHDAPPFEDSYHTSRVHFECTNGGAEPLFSFDDKKRADLKSPAAASAVCTPGQTRECVGSGACRGGQACLPDGRGYGACDCGPTASPAPAAPSGVVPPPSDPTPPSTASSPRRRRPDFGPSSS